MGPFVAAYVSRLISRICRNLQCASLLNMIVIQDSPKGREVREGLSWLLVQPGVSGSLYTRKHYHEQTPDRNFAVTNKNSRR